MAHYEIEQSETGHVLGVYEGETPEAAIRAMLDDAGAGPDVEPDAGIVAREVDDVAHRASADLASR